MEPRHGHVVGLVLCLVGGLATVASLALAGAFGTAVLALAATGSVALALSNVPDREPFDVAPTLAHRVATWGGAIFALVLGVFVLVLGVASFLTFA